jgi:hypothetical protein
MGQLLSGMNAGVSGSAASASAAAAAAAAPIPRVGPNEFLELYRSLAYGGCPDSRPSASRSKRVSLFFVLDNEIRSDFETFISHIK